VVDRSISFHCSPHSTEHSSPHIVSTLFCAGFSLRCLHLLPFCPVRRDSNKKRNILANLRAQLTVWCAARRTHTSVRAPLHRRHTEQIILRSNSSKHSYNVKSTPICPINFGTSFIVIVIFKNRSSTLI
jgi:hypothetical protein